MEEPVSSFVWFLCRGLLWPNQCFHDGLGSLGASRKPSESCLGPWDSGLVSDVLLWCFRDWVRLMVCITGSESEQLEAAGDSSKPSCVGGTAGGFCTSPYVRDTHLCLFLMCVWRMCVDTLLWMAGEGVGCPAQSPSLLSSLETGSLTESGAHCFCFLFFFQQTVKCLCSGMPHLCQVECFMWVLGNDLNSGP